MTDERMIDPQLTQVVGYFEEYQEATMTARSRNERDRDYVDHKQYTSDELATLQARKQPPVINNRIRKKINFLRGLERQGRSDPKAYPRTPQHEEDAQAITDAVRFVVDNAKFDHKRSQFFENYIVEGTGGAEVPVEFKNGNPEIQVNHIAWDRLFWDPHSRELDFSDAKYRGIVLWMDKADALSQWPDQEHVISSCFENDMDDTFADKPVHWVDSNRRRVRIVMMYHEQGGKWFLSFFVKAGFLIKPTLSPYKDEDGFPTYNIEMQSAYVDRNGFRYGEPRFMIELQDAVNKRESKMLHLVNQRQTYGNEKGIKDVRKAKSELAKPDGHIEMQGESQFGEDFGVLPTGDMATGQFTLLQEAKSELDQVSVNASLTGSDSRDLSGRAIIAQQSGGQMEITPLMDGKRAWELRIYRQIWARIKQFWTQEKWVRVTDNENNIKWAGINVPIRAGEQLEQEFGFIPPEFAGDPRLNQVVGVRSPVSQIDVDIQLEDAPDAVTIQQEQLDNLVALAQAGVTFPPDTYIRASQLRNKDELIESLGPTEDMQAQAQAAAQLDMADKAAEVDKKQAEAFEKEMKGIETQQGLMIP